jgi:hypothetical protein
VKNIRNKLSLATCGLLSQHAAGAAEIDNAWVVDSSAAYYSENERVTVYTLIEDVKGIVSNSDTANLKVVLDTMSGPTPSGSVKKTNLTFTGASGGSIASGGETASLALFDDTRVALSLDWNHEFDRLNNITYNGAFSVENDYRSFSGGATYKKSSEDRALEFTFGAAGTTDEIFVVGTKATPVPLSETSKGLTYGSGTKNTVEFLAGLTYVINKRTIAQLNLAGASVKGYLNDPYKIFSIVDNNGIEYDQYNESRPNSRIRYSATLNLNHQLYPDNDILSMSYRLFNDDWEIRSHTLDVLYRINMSAKTHLVPHFRFYRQTSAYFYNNSFTRPPTDPNPVSTVLPEYVSADYRLDDLQSLTAGITLGQYLGVDGKLRSRVEFIHQSFEHAEYNTLNSWVVQFSYEKKF